MSAYDITGFLRTAYRPFAYCVPSKHPLNTAYQRDGGVTLLLKGIRFSVDFDFPKEIADARRSLWPFYKELRNTERGSKIQIHVVYPAKVIKMNALLRMQCLTGPSM